MSLLSRPVASSDGIILRSWPSGETSLVVSVLTAEYGYLRLIAKSARRSRSKLRPVVQPGSLVSLEFTMVEGRQLQYLRGGALLPLGLKGEATLERSAYLLAAVELVDQCRQTDTAGGALFDLSRAFVETMNVTDAGREVSVFYCFEMGLLELNGLAPILDICAGCGCQVADNGGRGWFNPSVGGLCCRDCAGTDSRALSIETAAWLRLLAKGKMDSPPSRDAARQTGILLHRFLAFHLPAYRLPSALDVLRPPRI